MPQGQQNLYVVLGVLRDASAEEIKRAYYSAARRLHPDKNILAGETELFLEVQHAYEVLSNSKRRAQYDATLPPEETGAGPIEFTIQYSRPHLVHLDEPQLLYTLLEVAPRNTLGKVPATPLNLCLVLDRSTSMTGEKMDLAKAGANRVIRMLRPEDIFGLVVFSDRAEVLLSSGYQRDANKAQSRIQSIQPRGATEIFRGLEAGLAEVRRALDPNRSNHLLLLTDGHTYGDEQACLELAEEAARLNISISGFGIGGDWNDIFLDALSSRTGGNSTYISDARQIQHHLTEKLKALARVLVDDALLESKALPGIQLRSVFRLQPEGGPIDPGEAMHLGPILQDRPLDVLFEFLVEPSASSADTVTLLDGTVRAIVTSRPTPFPPMRLRFERPAAESASAEPPPAEVALALSRFSLYRLQDLARQEAAAGEYESATRHLKNLALQLQAQGQNKLAETALLEAELLDGRQAMSLDGGKEIKYGTRALMLPAPEKPK